MAVIDDLLKPQNAHDIQDDMYAKMRQQEGQQAAQQPKTNDYTFTAGQMKQMGLDVEGESKQKKVDVAQPTYEPGKFLKEYLKANQGYKPLTVEEQEAEKKRQNRNMLLGSIGDALSAFHTAYANARGVKPMVNPGESLTGKMRERYDRLNKEREARDLTYHAGLQQAMQRDEQNALSWQTLKERAKQREAAEARAEQARKDRIAREEVAAAQKAAELAEKKRHNEAMEKRPVGRGSTTTRKNQDWTTTKTDKNGKVVSKTIRTYGSGSSDNKQQTSQTRKSRTQI